jgi:hypothetical protein
MAQTINLGADIFLADGERAWRKLNASGVTPLTLYGRRIPQQSAQTQ